MALRAHLLIFCFTLAFWAHAAPHPSVNGSGLLDRSKGLFLLPHGFTLSLTNDWDFTVIPPSEDLSTVLQARSLKKSLNAQLLISKNMMDKNLSLEAYTKKWILNYAHYGFEIISQKVFQMDSKKALAIDLKEMRSNQRARQYIQVNQNQAIIITCSDDKSSFDKTLQNCNSIVKSFKWASTPEKTL